jgi:hypothetical protein
MQNSPPDKEGDKSGPRESGGRRELLRYAGLSSQVAGSIAIAVLLGIKADKWLKVSFPILSWCLPLLVIVVLIIKLIKDSSGNNDGK